MEEYKRTLPLGFLMAFVFLMHRFLPKELYKQLMSLQNTNEITNALVRLESFRNVFDLYSDLVLEAESKGVFDQIKRIIRNYKKKEVNDGW